MPSAEHAKRDHATWSASASERNFRCPGALALTKDLPEHTSREADWGTCCHQIAEKCLRGYGPADKFIGSTEKGKVHSFEVDEEMAETAQTYVDYVVSCIDLHKDTGLKVEQNFSLASLKPPFDAGGTADAVIFYPKAIAADVGADLEVVDLKGGRGVVVSAKGNPQLRTYALGAMLANPGRDVKRVKVTIVQPRAGHPEGRIRSETFHVADLAEWTADLLVAMRKSAQADTDYAECGDGLSRAEWASTYLKPGDHCHDTFCKARATCPALEKAALDAAGVWFDEIGAPRLANMPDAEDPAKLARDLDMLDIIEGWIKAVREKAHYLAESGVDITDPATGATYILVDKEGREKWLEGAEEKVVAAVRQAGLPEAKWRNPGKLRTPKQIRKELGSKADLVAGLSETPHTGHNLVRADKTNRSAATPAAHQHFSVIE